MHAATLMIRKHPCTVSHVAHYFSCVCQTPRSYYDADWWKKEQCGQGFFMVSRRCPLYLSMNFLPSSITPCLHDSPDLCERFGVRPGQSLIWHWVLMFVRDCPNFHQREKPSKTHVRLSLPFISGHIIAIMRGFWLICPSAHLRWSKEECSKLWGLSHCSVVAADLTWAPHWSSLFFTRLEVIQILRSVENPNVSLSASIKSYRQRSPLSGINKSMLTLLWRDK